MQSKAIIIELILEDKTDASVVLRGDLVNIPRVETLVEE